MWTERHLATKSEFAKQTRLLFLHSRQVIALQMRENDLVHQVSSLESKLSRADTQLFRLSKRADEKEQLSFQVSCEF